MIPSVSIPQRKSIPKVSDAPRLCAYAYVMEDKEDKTPYGWGARFRQAAYQKGWSLATLAEEMVDENGKPMAESSLRSWTNGNRDINLSDFLRLCGIAKLDPAVILFGGAVDPEFLIVGEAWVRANPMQKGVLVLTAKGILSEGGASAGQQGKAS